MVDPVWLEAALADWRRRGLERSLGSVPAVPDVLNFADNDYLGLSRHPAVLAGAMAAMREDGTGARASRVMAGNLPGHQVLEQRLASLKGAPAALLFGSGFLANLGVLTALIGRGDTVLLDRLAHASLVDGARLSGARLLRFQHNDPDHLQALLQRASAGQRRLVVTESVFSMDGDLAPLAEIAAVAAAGDAMLLVDEAHATGVFGFAGAGLFHPAESRYPVAIAMGTLSKALGSYGGFVVCSEMMRTYLIQRARSFTYSTALPPGAVGAALAAIDICAEQPELAPELLSRAARFRQRLQQSGVDTGRSDSQIVPVMLGDTARAVRLAEALRQRRIICPAIRPPTVPPGGARLRFSITLRHTPAEIDGAADTLLDLIGS